MFAKLAATLAILFTLPLAVGATPIIRPIIQEVLYDAPGSDSPFVFTELVAPPLFDFAGWSLVGVNGSTGEAYRIIDLSGAVVPSDGIFVIATASAQTALAEVRDFIANVDWQNGPDAVQLRNALGGIVDAFQYGDAGSGNAGEGSPAPRVAPGRSLSRSGGSLDTGNNFADFVESEPTPGWILDDAATEISGPPSFALVMMGAAVLFRRRQRSNPVVPVPVPAPVPDQ